ncbi:putative capsular polysaccharide synthesis family protein [Thalassotalea piscium]
MSILTTFIKHYRARKALLTQYADEESVFIYQMGKVGSTSLENAIPQGIHIHAFYSKNNTCPIRQAALSKLGIKRFFYILEREIMQYLLRRVFKKRKSTKIITIVRDPIARNMSMFFHDLDAYLFSVHSNFMNTRRAPLPTRSQPKSLLTKVFNEAFDHDYPLNWFDNEFKPMTNIDVFSKPFKREQGYSLFESDTLSVLLMSTEKLAQLTPVISDFLGYNVMVSKENSAQSKWYSDIYSDFKVHYTMPVDIENRIKSSKYFKHFYQ